MFNVLAGHRHAPQRLKYAALLLLLLVPFISVYASSTPQDITLTTTVTVDEISLSSEIWLVRLTQEANDVGSAAIGLRWTKDATGWFPTWQLQLTSNIGLLPTSQLVHDAGQTSFVQLGQIAPVAGHTYEVTLSYSASLGALAIRVHDITDNRTIYADGFPIPSSAVALYAPSGTTSPHYVPIGTTWTTGSGEPGGPFVPLSQFERRGEKGVIRLISPAPFPPGEYRITLEHNDIETLVSSVTPAARETIIPLPMDELPLGRSTVRVDYVRDGEVLVSESRTLTFGRIDFWLQPVIAERAEGVLKASFDVLTPEAFPDRLAVEVLASIYELMWDEGRRQFDLIPYAQDMAVHKATLDLSTGRTQLDVNIPLPDRPGNWRVRLTPHFPSHVATRIQGQERQFSTHLPAQVNPGDEYTIVVLPDTQYFARSYPDIFTRMTDWVTSNANEMGIAAVLHVGDITDNNSPLQWENAYAGMSLLHDVVPYVFTIGNHDMVAPDGSALRGHTLINKYFPVEMAERYSNLAGTMIPGRMENHYALLSIAGTDYLVISLEFWPPDEAINWANEIAKQYPHHKLILLTHSYTSSSGSLSLTNLSYPITQDPTTTVNSAVALWELLLRLNPNSFMAVSGHVASSAPVVPHRVPRNAAGNPVFELLFNWQNQPNGGNGWLGLMTFKSDGTMEVNVLSPYLGEYADERDGNGHTSHLLFDLSQGSAQRVFGR